MRRSSLAAALGLAASVAFVPVACVLGGDEPGCRSDDECPDGFACRAGACFRFTTDAGPPRDPAEAGDGPSDAAGDHR